ncbi:Esterase-like activity of phytase, partial [Epsilonproteobacteria bacterium SCGC AD-308-O04]
SEGMVFVDNNLLISFEKEPRVELFSLKAREIKKEKIHKDLKNIDDYKNENKALEGVAYNKKHGVVTAPEVPLKKENKRFHIIYAKDNTWKFPSGGSITALEFISNDEILVLERKFNKKSKTRVATLTQVSLDTCSAGVCKSKILAKIESKKGWKIDNFEGLTKIEQNKFLMISDSQESSAQKTLLIFFEVLED